MQTLNMWYIKFPKSVPKGRPWKCYELDMPELQPRLRSSREQTNNFVQDPERSHPHIRLGQTVAFWDPFAACGHPPSASSAIAQRPDQIRLHKDLWIVMLQKKTFRSAVLQHLSILFLSQAHDLYSNHAPTMPQLTNKLNHCKCQHNWGPCSYRPGQSQKTPLRKWSKNLLKRNVKNAEADAHECSASSIHVAWSPL